MSTAYASLIRESADDLRILERAARHRSRADRFRLLRLLKEGRVSALTQAAALLGCHIRTAQRWWQGYRAGGLAALEPSADKRGGHERITPEAWAGLQEEMRAGRVGGLHEAQVYLRERWRIDYGIDAISKLLRRRKTKLKTGRPRHRKAADPAAQAAFKK